jgi:hypothetical protein
LKKEFDDTDIDSVVRDVDLHELTESDESSDSDIDSTPKTKRERSRKQKTVRFDMKTVPVAPAIEPVPITNIDALNRQVQELALERQQLLQELAASRLPANVSMGTCFMCDGVHVHRLGVRNCPETGALISEGLIMFSPQGRLVRMDGTDLPRNTIGSGGVARSLREERAHQNKPGSFRKGKERETPPHFTQHAGIQCDGHDLLDRDVYAISSTSTWPISYPATRSQKEPLFEPYPLKKPERKQKPAPIIPPPTKRTPELQKPVPPPLPTVLSVQQASKPVKTTPNMLSEPTLAPQPPYRNTADTWKDQRKAKPVAKKADHQDVKMQDASKNKGGYHFTSMVQEMADGDAIQARILDTIIMLPLQEIFSTLHSPICPCGLRADYAESVWSPYRLLIL